MTVASVEGPSESAGEASGSRSFGDRLAERVASRESQLVLGLDPNPASLWPAAVEGSTSIAHTGSLVVMICRGMGHREFL